VLDDCGGRVAEAEREVVVEVSVELRREERVVDGRGEVMVDMMVEEFGWR
jgi:hypothetical protein